MNDRGPHGSRAENAARGGTERRLEDRWLARNAAITRWLVWRLEVTENDTFR